MAIITFLSDFGESDHYVAAVKAKILSIDPTINVVDLSHQVAACDIAHGAHILKSVFRDFPEETVHLVAVDSVCKPEERYIAVELENHYFVGTDNGLLGLISDKPSSVQVDINSVNPVVTTFPARQILAPTAAKLASGTTIQDIGQPLDGFKKMLGRHLKANKRLISGHVVRVDNYGNLITNIDKNTFDILSKDKSYSIIFGRENTRRMQDGVHSVDPGDLFVIFNDLGYLEVGINQGKASELLGLGYDSPVMIKFDE